MYCAHRVSGITFIRYALSQMIWKVKFYKTYLGASKSKGLTQDNSNHLRSPIPVEMYLSFNPLHNLGTVGFWCLTPSSAILQLYIYN